MRSVVVVGHVDHGKSTLLGRLLADTGRIAPDKIEAVQKTCSARGMQLEPAFFLDALDEEQSQGITIDTTSVDFEFEGKRFQFIDAPGHLDFLKNMASGASRADCAIVVLDVNEGIRAQTRRHLQVLSMLGINNIIVALNKMDFAGYDQTRFDLTASQMRQLLEIERCTDVAMVPMSALHGDNLASRTSNMGWYNGPSLLEAVCAHSESVSTVAPAPLRMVLQDVYKFDKHRYYVGQVVSGEITQGTQIMFSPSGKVAQIESIDVFGTQSLESAGRGSSVALRLQDELFVERGEVISGWEDIPRVETELHASIVWMVAEQFDQSKSYLLKLGTKQVPCSIRLGENGNTSSPLTKGDIAHVVIETASPVAFDVSTHPHALNKFVLCTEYEPVAAGIVDTQERAKQDTAAKNVRIIRESGYIERSEREAKQKHRGAVVWLTGLSGAGKSALAKALERHLFEAGCNVVAIDADNVRSGLSSDLGFSPADRAENVRRLAELGKLLKDSGAICIIAAISPYTKDRETARSIIGAEDFSEVFVFCPLEVCQQRDSKGLYKSAAAGEIKSFTGLQQPYQQPAKPHLRLDTSLLTVSQEILHVERLLRERGVLYID